MNNLQMLRYQRLRSLELLTSETNGRLATFRRIYDAYNKVPATRPQAALYREMIIELLEHLVWLTTETLELLRELEPTTVEALIEMGADFTEYNGRFYIHS